MPQVESVKKQRKGLAVAVGVGALAVVALVGVLVFWLANGKPEDTTAATQAAIDDSRTRLFKDDKDGAVAVLQTQLEKARTNDEKLALYMALGSAYVRKNDYASALAAFHKAADIKPGYGTNEPIARVAELAGDKVTAIDYYKRNRTLIKEGKASVHNEELPDIEASIVRLGGSL